MDRSKMVLPTFYKTRFLGIDQSLSCTGVIAADLKLNIKRALTIDTYPDIFPEARINQIGCNVDSILKIEGDHLHFVAIELPAFNANGLRDVLHGVYWEIRRRVWIYNPKLEVISVPINSWKKYSVGHGNATKAMIQEEVKKRYGKYFHDENLYDAYGLMLWAINSWKTDQKKHHRGI
ncbi:MAG: hypothetical protein KAS39_04855 [Actinomycetia bacterium]|nr:hypothetical protein [Actinomycetes bacterium]